MAWMRATVESLRMETHKAKTLQLSVPDWPGHLAGQHVDVRLTAEDGYQAQRSYSIASPPGAASVELTVEMIMDGEVSPYLTEIVMPGDMFELRGPIGGYFVWTETLDGPLVLIGGGSGIVPLMAMLRHRTRTGHETPAILLYSSRSRSYIIYREELDALAGSDPAFTLIHTLTRANPMDWNGYTRRIDEAMLAEIGIPALENPNIFVCGPTPMVESAASALVRLGIAPQRIKTERFGPSGS
ncbi:MAG: oxidoreductase [Rhodomicrobium sp.]|nr:oxidoreductase [Rhodomicrobium sp.]